MPYIKLADSTYPVYQDQIRRAFPNTSFPQVFAGAEGYAEVFPTQSPNYDNMTQGAREIAPVSVAGRYEQRWEVYALDAGTIAQKAEAARLAFNAVVHAQLAEADLKIIRALAESDTARIATHRTAQATLRAGLR